MRFLGRILAILGSEIRFSFPTLLKFEVLGNENAVLFPIFLIFGILENGTEVEK